MEFDFVKENEDGSADYIVHLDAPEVKALLLFGLRRALEEAVATGNEWRIPTEEVKDE